MAIEINNTVKESRHLADRKSVQLIQAKIDNKPVRTIKICNCPKLIFGRLMMENSICMDDFRQSIPKDRLHIIRWSVMPIAKETIKIANEAAIFVTTSLVRPCLVQRKILSAPV